mgnify:CR=1 FL=1
MSHSETVLITGGAGFVGSHIVDRLMESGAEVIVVDNFHTGSKTNFTQHLAHPRFELIRHNVWDHELLKALHIPDSVLPRVVPSSHVVGHTDAALLGNLAAEIESGMPRRARAKTPPVTANGTLR